MNNRNQLQSDKLSNSQQHTLQCQSKERKPQEPVNIPHNQQSEESEQMSQKTTTIQPQKNEKQKPNLQENIQMYVKNKNNINNKYINELYI